MQGRVLIVAGSDSGGGAGIQADIKTVTALGGFAMTAVTAITAQNTLGVQQVHEVPEDVIAQQLVSVLSDIGADVIKTGMLSSSGIIRTVSEGLASSGSTAHRIVDPVMVAKGGHKLLADDAIEALKTRLIAGAALVTPNLPEAEVLTGKSVKAVEDMYAVVDPLRELGARAVLLKGGHLTGDRLIDLLITPDGILEFEGARITTSSDHGTGCTLASAAATGMAQGLDLAESVKRARSYVRAAIATAPGLGAGHGPLNHGHAIPTFGYSSQ